MNRLASELGDIPVIFGGINNYTPNLHENLNATGIAEDIDIYSNISLIERIQPQVKLIHIVSDHSVSGAGIRKQVGMFLANYPHYRDRIVSYIPDTYEQLLEHVS